MNSITNFFSNKNIEKNNDYKEEFIKILIKKRNNLTTIYGLIDKYSQDTKKKIEVIMKDKKEILETIEQLKNDSNIIYHFYCKDGKLYYVFEYSLVPIIKKFRNDVNINIREEIDGQFSSKITANTIKDILVEPGKYINFCIKNTKIDNYHVLHFLILTKEYKLLNDIIESYKISLTDYESGCGIKYKDLLEIALTVGDTNIVNTINKCYYENKLENDYYMPNDNLEKDKYQKYYQYLNICSTVSSIFSFPFILYIFFYSC